MKQALQDELDELLNIPQVERIIHHKVEELKIYLKDEIEYYRQLKEGFRRMTYGELTVLEADPGAEGRGGRDSEQKRVYLFQLNKDARDRWGPPGLEPLPPAGYDPRDVFPDRLVNHIAGDAFSLREFHTVTGLLLPGIENVLFDLQFTRYSEHHMLGTVCRREIRSAAAEEENHCFDPKEAEEGDCNELLHYMQKYPSLRIYFLTEFYMKMKPMINGNVVKLTASLRRGDRF